jgi:tetratricopeptide (TPR) repeat protein
MEFTQMTMLGRIHRLLGEVRQALEYLEQALAMTRDTGTRQWEGSVLGFLGDVYRDIGMVKEAMEHYKQALALHRAIKYPRGELFRVIRLGNAYLDVGDIQQALAYYEHALAMVREIGGHQWEGRMLGYLGHAHVVLEALPQSLEYYERALAILRSLEDREGLSEVLVDLGMLHHFLGHLTEAGLAYAEALRLDFPTTNYCCAVMLGLLRLEQGDTPGAQEALIHGITLCHALLEKTPHLYRPLYTLALAHLASGRPDIALATYRQAVAVCAAPGVVQGAQHALTLLQRVAPPLAGVTDTLVLLAQVREQAGEEPVP